MIFFIHLPTTVKKKTGNKNNTYGIILWPSDALGLSFSQSVLAKTCIGGGGGGGAVKIIFTVVPLGR